MIVRVRELTRAAGVAAGMVYRPHKELGQAINEDEPLTCEECGETSTPWLWQKDGKPYAVHCLRCNAVILDAGAVSLLRMGEIR